MKAWLVDFDEVEYYEDCYGVSEYGPAWICVHAETAGKAKVHALQWNNGCWQDSLEQPYFINLRIKRMPEYDNAPFPLEGDPHMAEIECGCELCQGHIRYLEAKP